MAPHILNPDVTPTGREFRCFCKLVRIEGQTPITVPQKPFSVVLTSVFCNGELISADFELPTGRYGSLRRTLITALRR